MLGLSLRKILTLFGGALMLFVFFNVQFGSVAPLVIDGAEGYKLDALLMFEPSCSFDLVEEELRASGTSYCLGEVGQWSGADVLMLILAQRHSTRRLISVYLMIPLPRPAHPQPHLPVLGIRRALLEPRHRSRRRR